jgi:hypothetical protein
MTSPKVLLKEVFQTVRSKAFFFLISIIFSFPYGHPVAAYLFFHVFPSFLHFLQQRVVEDSSEVIFEQTI